MTIRGHPIPESMAQAMSSGRLRRERGSWPLREVLDAFGNRLETELGEFLETEEAIEQATDALSGEFKTTVSMGSHTRRRSPEAFSTSWTSLAFSVSRAREMGHRSAWITPRILSIRRSFGGMTFTGGLSLPTLILFRGFSRYEQVTEQSRCTEPGDDVGGSKRTPQAPGR